MKRWIAMAVMGGLGLYGAWRALELHDQGQPGAAAAWSVLSLIYLVLAAGALRLRRAAEQSLGSGLRLERPTAESSMPEPKIVPPPVEDSLVEIVPGIEVALARSLLQAHGVTTYVRDELSSLMPLPFTTPRLFVLASDREVALDILQETPPGPDET